jgi:hypothetical protein
MPRISTHSEGQWRESRVNDCRSFLVSGKHNHVSTSRIAKHLNIKSGELIPKVKVLVSLKLSNDDVPPA